jgi:hypothetical protein
MQLIISDRLDIEGYRCVAWVKSRTFRQFSGNSSAARDSEEKSEKLPILLSTPLLFFLERGPQVLDINRVLSWGQFAVS